MSNKNGKKVWFITGASRGFGALIAAEALAAGDAVVAAARDPASVTARLGQHANLLPVRLDVTREEQAQEAVKQAVKKFGRIDVLVQQRRLRPQAAHGVVLRGIGRRPRDRR